MKKVRCYNAGKVGGLPYIVAHRNFELADEYIRELGFQPVNPLYNGLHASSPWLLHIIVDICLLAKCKAVFFQNSWQNSKGARIEYAFAKFLGKDMIFQQSSKTEREIRLNVSLLPGRAKELLSTKLIEIKNKLAAIGNENHINQSKNVEPM